MDSDKRQSQTEIQYTPYKFANIPYRQVQIYCRTGKEEEYKKCNIWEKNKKIVKLNQHEKKGQRQGRKKNVRNPDEYYVKPQNKFRNVVSNLIHHFVRHLSSEKQVYEGRIHRIISAYSLEINCKQFYQKLDCLVKQMKNYITVDIMKEFWFSETQIEFCKTMRILGRYFYKTNGFLSIFYSNKICEASKGVHYKCLKMIQQALVSKNSANMRYQLKKLEK